MNLQDIKDQISDTIKGRWADFQESNLYSQIRERYDDLSPIAQKFVQAGVAAFILLFLVMMPWSWMDAGSEKLESFDSKKGLIRQLLQLKRDVQQAPLVPMGTDSAGLKNQVQTTLQAAGLTTDQIRGLEEVQLAHDKSSSLIPETVMQSGVQITIWKINLQQLTDISFRLQKVSSGAKLLSLDLKANADDVHYFDVIYQLVSFAPPKGMATDSGEEKD